MTAPPYANLTPDRVLDALEAFGLESDGRLLALNSYENRVYQIGLHDGPAVAVPQVIVKFYRPGRWSDEAILEEHAFVTELVGHEIPVVAPLALDGDRTLYAHRGFRFSVYPKHGGRVPELCDLDTLKWMGRFIGRLHAVGAVRPFRHRPTLDIASFGEAPRDFLLGGEWVPPDLVPAYRSIVEQAILGVRRCFARAGSVGTLRLHGDCYAGNVLWTHDGPHFVDFDDSRMGPAIQDLWMLLSGDRAAMTGQLAAVLAGYEDFNAFEPRELYLVEALRTLRLLHYSAWIARRWDDPAFPAAFPWFDTPRYWQDRILELREQVALMDEPPLGPA